MGFDLREAAKIKKGGDEMTTIDDFENKYLGDDVTVYNVDTFNQVALSSSDGMVYLSYTVLRELLDYLVEEKIIKEWKDK